MTLSKTTPLYFAILVSLFCLDTFAEHLNSKIDYYKQTIFDRKVHQVELSIIRTNEMPSSRMFTDLLLVPLIEVLGTSIPINVGGKSKISGLPSLDSRKVFTESSHFSAPKFEREFVSNYNSSENADFDDNFFVEQIDYHFSPNVEIIKLHKLNADEVVDNGFKFQVNVDHKIQQLTYFFAMGYEVRLGENKEPFINNQFASMSIGYMFIENGQFGISADWARSGVDGLNDSKEVSFYGTYKFNQNYFLSGEVYRSLSNQNGDVGGVIAVEYDF